MFLKNNSLAILSVLLILLFYAVIPKTLNYQGKILNSDGVGFNDTLDITFRLYPDETGGSHLWVQTLSNVPISKGLFSVELSRFPDTVDFSSQYYLEIEIDSEILSPREKLSSSPYAIHSEYTSQAIQSVHTSEDTTHRTGRMVFRGGEGVTISDTPDSIMILFEGISGGSTFSGISANTPLTGDGTEETPLAIDYDDITIGLNISNKLSVKEGSIGSSQIANESIQAHHIADGSIHPEHISDLPIPSQPTITNISPDNLLEDYTPATITITGTNFEEYAQVMIGDLELTDEIVTDGISISATLPDGLAVGTYDVSVYNWWKETTSSNAFEVKPLFPTNGLISYYKLDEISGTTVYDSYGSHNGTRTGATIGASGKIETAYYFDGISDHYVNTGFTYDILPISVSLWINYSGSTGTDNYFVNNENGGYDLNIGSSPTNYLRINVGNLQVTTEIPLSTSVWTHLVCIWSTTNIYLYKNGILVWSRGSGTGSFTGGNWFIGTNGGNRIGKTNGTLDEIGIWNRTLTEGEIQMLYNSGNGLPYPD